MCKLLTALTTAILVWTSSDCVVAAPPVLVILRPTGQEREGLPVLEHHPDAQRIADTLLRGFSGRLLRLFALEQEFLHQQTGRAPEPAYLALTDRQGGFPQVGFFLGDERKSEAGWVELPRSSALSGRFGALDQIFPHELLHVIVHQLAGEPRQSGSNQIHAVGVRTDPVIAFHEGLTEAVQILAVDDLDAADDTQALATDDEVSRRAHQQLGHYARDLTGRFLPVRSSQMRFIFWFNGAEQVMRYHAVKANAFARRTVVPEQLLVSPDKYAAYLYQSVVPAASDDPPKSAAVMLSTEGVVAHLFWRWVTDTALARRPCGAKFYAQFGVQQGNISPGDNAFLKLFVALHAGKPATAVELIRAYVAAFPEEALDVERVVDQTLLGQPLPDAPEIWLANAALQTGTSLFDQFRTLPRAHTFDINAATQFDWLAVPGVTPQLATRLVAGAPYRHLDDLLAAPELDASVRARIAQMAEAMDAIRTGQMDEPPDLTVILRSYLWRLAAIVLVSMIVGAGLARRAGVERWWTAAFISLSASLLVVVLAWIVTCPPWYPLAAPVVLGGAPWAIWRFLHGRKWREVLRPLTAWIAAMLPAMILTRAGW
jgi:hypothetical protein